MNVKLLTENHLEKLSRLKRRLHAQACLSLHLSKHHIGGNHMSWLIFEHKNCEYSSYPLGEGGGRNKLQVLNNLSPYTMTLSHSRLKHT